MGEISAEWTHDERYHLIAEWAGELMQLAGEINNRAVFDAAEVIHLLTTRSKTFLEANRAQLIPQTKR